MHIMDLSVKQSDDMIVLSPAGGGTEIVKLHAPGPLHTWKLKKNNSMLLAHI